MEDKGEDRGVDGGVVGGGKFDVVRVIGGFVVAGSGQRRRGRGSRGEIGSSTRSESMAGAWTKVVTFAVEEDEDWLRRGS